PYSSISGMRVSKFVKYLPAQGWKPWVLTVDPRYYGERGLTKDPRLVTDLATTRIIHAPYFRFPGHVLTMKLLHPLIALGFAWKHRRRLDAVYLCGSPFHPFLLTVILTGLLRIPTVLDFRDSWSINHGYDGQRPNSLLARLRETVLGLIERVSIRFASSVTFATTRLQEEYTALFPASRHKYHTIHNGFDPDDFVRIKPRRSSPGQTVVLSGQFHVYTPDAVDSLMTCLRNDPDIHFVYVGGEQSIIAESARRAGVTEQVTARPYMPYREVLSLTAGADVGLVTTGLVNGLGTKIFDYLALGKPTVCLVPSGSVIASEFGTVPTVVISHPPHTPERIAAALETAFGMVGTPCRADIGRYSRRESTRQLARLLDDIAT
ncbi:MAG: glycosyltransferase, partial [Thiohalocapsa sp.]